VKKNSGEGDYLTITKFDDEVADILSNIPDTEEISSATTIASSSGQ
jgi:hypothetical protein